MGKTECERGLKGKTVDEILNYLGGTLGKVWSPLNNGALGLNVSNDLRIVFYIATSTEGPTISVNIDGTPRIKIRLK